MQFAVTPVTQGIEAHGYRYAQQDSVRYILTPFHAGISVVVVDFPASFRIANAPIHRTEYRVTFCTIRLSYEA